MAFIQETGCFSFNIVHPSQVKLNVAKDYQEMTALKETAESKRLINKPIKTHTDEMWSFCALG